MPKAGSHPIFTLLETGQPAELGPGPRPGVRGEREVRELAAKALKETASAKAELCTALLLLWHDHLDAAHTISQAIANQDGSFVHGIIHRREPDAGNAAYWFRRVGDHPSYPALADGVASFLAETHSNHLKSRFLPSGKWNPFAFVDACSQATAARDNEKIDVLRQIQRIETEVLLRHWIG